MQDQKIVWFSEVDKDDVSLVGGKGANLGELYKLGIPIPNGFIVTSQAYFTSIKSLGILDQLRSTLFDLYVEDPLQLGQKAHACQNFIKNIKLDEKLEKKLNEYYQKLSGQK